MTANNKIEPMRVLYLASEAIPFVKVGGLGDVAGTLPPALRALPAAPDVRLVLPFHNAIDRGAYDLNPITEFSIAHSSGPQPVEVFAVDLHGLPVYLIDGPPVSAAGNVYSSDAHKDGEKFIFFSLAALELARRMAWPPHILHANDWHTAPAIHALELDRRKRSFFQNTAGLLTVHNLPYLGAGIGPALQDFGLPPRLDQGLPDWAVNLPLPLGLAAADHITTVSPGYAAEIITAEFGSGLHQFLRSRRRVVSGILNGLDLHSWDPAADKHLPVRFSAKSLAARTKNKAALQAEVALPLEPTIPLLAVVSRMDHQKGIDLALAALRQLADLPWQVVILGTGDPGLEAQARRLATDFPAKVAVFLRYDDALARRIYAGADAILIPSRYEPCGLTQMIAMRYGCLPVARATGGLRDTIVDYGVNESSTGFLFSKAASSALAGAIRRAFEVFADHTAWVQLQRRAMLQDFSWVRSAHSYFDLYDRLVTSRRSEVPGSGS